MYRIKHIALLALLCAAIISACDSAGTADQAGPTAPPTTADAETVASDFLEAWTKNDYATMYGLISATARLTSLDQFKQAYDQVEQIIRPGEQGKSFELLRDKTERQGNTVAVHYNMTFNSGPLGQFSDPNRTMRLVITPNGWRVAWSTMDIFEGLAGGAVLSLDRTQSPRGTIDDRNGKVIAQDGVPNVSVRLLPGKYPTGNAQDCFRKLADIFRLKFSDLAAAYTQYTEKQFRNFGFTIGHWSKDDYDAHHAELDAVCYIQYQPQTTRFYYGGGLAPQTIGFVAPIQKDQLGDYPDLSPDALVGLQGIEQVYQKQLAGESGAQLAIQTPDGIQVRVIHSKDPSPSQDITLSIDRDVQLEAEQALASAFSVANWAQFSTGAAAVVLDVNSGDVLAMANFPSVDPDAWLRTTTFDDGTIDVYVKRRALANRATRELYPLGSVFKIISMAAAADSGTFKLTQTYTCTGVFPDPEQPNGKRLDWIYTDKYVEHNYHGTITLVQALTGSCDTYFWTVGKTLDGVDAGLLRKYANQMGVGVKSGIDSISPGEVEGYVPDPQTKGERTGKKWGVGDSLNTVIGQGDVQVTPIEVARMMAGVANGGNLYRPVLVRSIGAPGQTPSYVAPVNTSQSMNIAPAVLKGIQQGLCDVPRKNIMPGTKNQNLGTAEFVFYNWDFNKVFVCGKTGTAQTGYPQPTGWFAAYAGKAGQKPDIAVVAVVERSREGSETAGPIVRRIIESYYGLPQEPWPDYWLGAYDPMVDPNVSDGGGPRIKR